MQAVTTIGLDIAKSVFQVHGSGGLGWFRRRQACRHACISVEEEADHAPVTSGPEAGEVDRWVALRDRKSRLRRPGPA